MKIYFAGDGHYIEKTPFIKYLIDRNFYCLLSYFKLKYEGNTPSSFRFNYIVNHKEINKKSS